MQHTLVGNLSGGERNRVLLAKLLCAGGNVLVLDEPTNDLDLATLRALEEALLVFPGAVLVVSHDRWFLDRIATHILHLDGHGGARLHTGDLSSLLERLKQEAAAARDAQAAAGRASKAGTSGAPASDAPRRKKKLAPWQAKELEEIEKRLPQLEAEIAAVDAELAEPSLYSGPAAKRERVQARRATLAAESEKLYARWEELETLRG